MTNEEFQRLVLEKLSGLEQGQSYLVQGQATLSEGQAKLDQRQANLEQRQVNLEQGQRILETKIENVQSNLATRMGNVEGQLSETNEIVRALMHRTEELDAKFDGLLHSVVDRLAAARLDAKMDVINKRLLEQEAEISILKKAK